MRNYLDQLRFVLENGADGSDRTGTGTRSVFGMQTRYDLRVGFPLLTTKKMFMRGIYEELLWFLRGDTNSNSLEAEGVNIWREWKDPDTGDLGPIYGKQWVSWEGKSGRVHNQIADVIDRINTDPHSRRLIVSAWNVDDIDRMALPPCHTLFQFYVRNGELSCQLYQRSADMFLGVPFNIASYSLLTHMVAHVTNLQPATFIHTIGDAHIYHNHFDQVKEQLSREPKAPGRLIVLSPRDSIFDIRYGDFVLEGYESHPRITAPIAV